MNLKKILGLGGLLLGVTLIGGVGALYVNASDHDDGETEIKGRNLNLTDLLVFREQDQNHNAGEGD